MSRQPAPGGQHTAPSARAAVGRMRAYHALATQLETDAAELRPGIEQARLLQAARSIRKAAEVVDPRFRQRTEQRRAEASEDRRQRAHEARTHT